MASQNETNNLLTADEQRQYNALMAALHGNVVRDTLPNNSPRFSTEDELGLRKNAENSSVLRKFWSK
jgi:hypothetical protein